MLLILLQLGAFHREGEVVVLRPRLHRGSGRTVVAAACTLDNVAELDTKAGVLQRLAECLVLRCLNVLPVGSLAARRGRRDSRKRLAVPLVGENDGLEDGELIGDADTG